MSGTVKKAVSLKNRVLAGLVAGGLLLAASGPTQATDPPDGARETTGAIVLGRKPSIIKRSDSTFALGRKPGIFKVGTHSV